MKIAYLEIENFQGVKFLSIKSLEDLPLVALSGKNGCGKTTCLLAISLLWGGEFHTDMSRLVGPWGDEARLRMLISLNMQERKELKYYARKVGAYCYEKSEYPEGQEEDEHSPQIIRMWLRIPKRGDAWRPHEDFWAETLRKEDFARENPFANISFIPGERVIHRSEVDSLSVEHLSEKSATLLRRQAVDSLSENYGSFSIHDIPGYLATLDYLDLSQGSRFQEESEYTKITNAFEAATGKSILKPSIDSTHGISIKVDAGEGNEHSISKLSSGEQEVLGLMYLCQRTAKKGSILLIDEPEIHLHPSLQVALVELAQGISGSSQIWLSTHSPNIINTAPSDSLISISLPSSEKINQSEKIIDQKAKTNLLFELGVSKSSWLQHEKMLIVEGETDKNFIEKIFPVETSKILIYPAGNKKSALATAKALAASEELLPWVCVVDRDLDDESTNEADKDDRIFVWTGRTIENAFLDEKLLHRVLTAASHETTVEEVLSQLLAIAEKEKEDVIKLLTENRIKERCRRKIGSPPKDTKEWFKFEAEKYKAYAELHDVVRRETEIEIEGNWPRRWKHLVQGKRILAQFNACTPFQHTGHFQEFMLKEIRENPDLLPDDFNNLKSLLQKGISST